MPGLNLTLTPTAKTVLDTSRDWFEAGVVQQPAQIATFPVESVAMDPPVSGEPVMTFTPLVTIQPDPNCCGVRHFAHMHERWNYPPGTAYNKNKEASTINHDLTILSLGAFQAKYPELYDGAYKAWNSHIDEQCARVRKMRAATIIMHFVKPIGCPSYVAGIMREVIKNRRNAVNLGEYINPNTSNTINGWCIPTSYKRSNRLDKEKA